VTRTAQVLKFVSRTDHLKWREQWKRGRWVRLSWPPEERAAIPRQDEEYRLVDIRWAVRHGSVAGGAIIAVFPQSGDRLAAHEHETLPNIEAKSGWKSELHVQGIDEGISKGGEGPDRGVGRRIAASQSPLKLKYGFICMGHLSKST
jgi:hypothetical protein